MNSADIQINDVVYSIETAEPFIVEDFSPNVQIVDGAETRWVSLATMDGKHSHCQFLRYYTRDKKLALYNKALRLLDEYNKLSVLRLAKKKEYLATLRKSYFDC